MKLHEGTWTRAYSRVATAKPPSAPIFPESVCWTYPLQKISSAGPIRNTSRADSSHGDIPSLIPYIVSTCGRAKSKSSPDTLSPVQKIPQRTAANIIPYRILTADHCVRFHQPGLSHVERPPRANAEQVIISQKSTCGAVSGENMTVHRAAARIIVKISFFIALTTICLTRRMPLRPTD